jgi:hypothetical protein
MQKSSDEAASKMEAMLERSEEQRCMIESLHTSVIFNSYLLAFEVHNWYCIFFGTNGS